MFFQYGPFLNLCHMLFEIHPEPWCMAAGNAEGTHVTQQLNLYHKLTVLHGALASVSSMVQWGYNIGF